MVRGTGDRTGIVPTAAAEWARRHVVVPAAGHHAHIDNPAFVNDLLEEFLDEVT